MAVGALMMPRIDHSVMPDGFQRIDQGKMNTNKMPAKAFTPSAEKKNGHNVVLRQKSNRVTGLYLKMLFTSSQKVKRYAIIQYGMVWNTLFNHADPYS